jgi:hypothetical protein
VHSASIVEDAEVFSAASACSKNNARLAAIIEREHGRMAVRAG